MTEFNQLCSAAELRNELFELYSDCLCGRELNWIEGLDESICVVA
jgi:hypothetical protein